MVTERTVAGTPVGVAEDGTSEPSPTHTLGGIWPSLDQKALLR